MGRTARAAAELNYQPAVQSIKLVLACIVTPANQNIKRRRKTASPNISTGIREGVHAMSARPQANREQAACLRL